jgi:predicted ATP-grasp superfamily ATP-dependent carboligase
VAARLSFICSVVSRRPGFGIGSCLPNETIPQRLRASPATWKPFLTQDSELLQFGYYAVNMTGLVEVEFKRDPAGKYRLLDVNPRVWTWHMLCGRAGIDFPYLLWLLACGQSFVTPQARPGISWMHFSSDFLVVAQEICRGRLSLNNYLRSILVVRESALLAVDDPLPAILDVPTSLYRWGRRRLQSLSRA